MKLSLNRKIIYFFILIVFLPGCLTIKSLFRAESSYYSPWEKKILSMTTSTMDYDYGFDSDIEIDYVFNRVPVDKPVSGANDEIVRILKRYDEKKVMDYYRKMYRLLVKTENLAQEYRYDEEWSDYIYVDTYLLPPLKAYVTVLEKSILVLSGNDMKGTEWKKAISGIEEDVIKELKQEGDIVEHHKRDVSYHYGNGELFRGTIKNRQKIEGTYYVAGGGRFIGTFSDGKMSKGIYYTARGSVYVGTLRDGVPHGKGKMTFVSGGYYEGGFRDGKRHGAGTNVYPNGDRYTGEYLKGARHGQGTYFRYDGTVVHRGRWVSGKFRD